MASTSFDNSLYSPAGTTSESREATKNGIPNPAEDGLMWSPSVSTKSGSRTNYARSIRRQDIAEVTSQLAIMTRSGVDVASALGSLASQCQRPVLAQVLSDAHERVLSGNTLSDALRQYPEAFEASFVATVAAGEASGKMSEVLGQLAQMQRSEIRSRRAICAMLTYPVLLMLVSSAVLVALVLFVLPRFANIFEQYEVPLPVITQVLIALADELWSRGWLWGPLVVAVITGALVWRKTDQGRHAIDAFLISAPIIRNVYRFQLVGRTCRLMGLMLQSGVPLVESLRLTRHAIGNMLYKELLGDLEEAVVNGRSLESALPTDEVLPRSAREMIVTAETTGKMGEVTQFIGVYYEEESEAGMRQLVGLLEPMIIVGMGILVAGVVLAVMLPVFDLSTLAKR